MRPTPCAKEDYKRLVPPTIAAFGGRYLARGGRVQVIEGDWSPNRLVILEFPSVERARAWWESVAYAEARAIRQATATSRLVNLDGA